jgi:hypothetical protein
MAIANDPLALLLNELNVDEKECGCITRRDYDGEKITTHCDNHCPKIGRKWNDLSETERNRFTEIGFTKEEYEWPHCGGC